MGNREKPIDSIAKNILLIEAASSIDKGEENEYTIAKNVTLLDLDVEIRNPLNVVSDLSAEELSELVEDISSYLQLEKRGKGDYAAFWQALREIAAAELRRRRPAGSSQGGLHASVEAEIQQLLAGKTNQQLKDMESDIEKNLREGKSRDVVSILST